ncbi:MAG: hypothetical protein R2712_05060 [Vicinamibacterales bacterium]
MRSSISTAASDSGVAMTARPCSRARATTVRVAVSSSSKRWKNSTIESASTWAGAGALADTSAVASSTCSLMADAPAAAAASTSVSARSTEPPWFSPTSAMTNIQSAALTRCFPIVEGMTVRRHMPSVRR